MGLRWPNRIALGAAAFAMLPALGAPPVAEVASVEGRGEFREAQQTTWQPAAVRQGLFATNFVRTLDQSKMAIVFQDRTQMRLAPNSTLQIKEVATPTEARTILNLNKGRAWTQSKATPNGLVVETPSALAAIRGTDWELAVDDEGRATLSVFSGEVEFSNGEGRVLVQRNESALAEKGKAPVKLLLQTSRDRMQWVSAFTVDRSRYAELRGKPPGTPAPPAVVALLASDEAIYAGDLDRARTALEAGRRSFPADERFDVGLARVALLRGDAAGARALANAAIAKRPGSADALVMLGEVERYEGRAPEALDAYARAVAAAPADARGWHGLGAVQGERDDYGEARANLEKAIALDPTDAAHHAELAGVMDLGGSAGPAGAELARALALQPDNYVALTALGALELRAGHDDAALDALLRAGAIEPRYARAHVYLAAAYYRAGRDAAAQAELARAEETDPNDPLPHILAAVVHLDRIEPGAAVGEAQQALARIPYLKSVNQVADNQKGVANVGAPLAFMGLELWARNAAQESYLPFWGASHLFLADRYPGDFDKRSELMQGFITDPLAFGAPNRFQSLTPQAGHYATASVRYNHSDDLHLVEPVLTLNGTLETDRPMAYFVEAIDTRIDPDGVALAARGRTFTAALGARPTAELATFVYANHLSLNADLGTRGETGDFDHIDGSAGRVDVGARYAFSGASSLWVKAGSQSQDSTSHDTFSVRLPSSTLVQQSDFTTKPRESDIALRHTTVLADSLEVTWGAEAARERSPRTLVRDAVLRDENTPGPLQSLDEVDHDRSQSLYAMGRWTLGPARLDLGLAWSDYRKDRDIDVLSGSQTRLAERYERRRVDPLAGLAWRFAPGTLARAACRRWARPIAMDTLSPVATAGIPLDDQLVFPGGVLESCGGALEWSDASRTFATLAAARIRVHNLVSPLDGVQNTAADITNLDRLRNRALAPSPKPDLLEDTPVYGEGTAKRASAAVERIVTPRLALRAQYTYTDSGNSAPSFAGNSIPYLPRNQVNLGATWAPGWHVLVTAQAVYRSRRFADEANLAPLAASWDGQLDVFWETPGKRWSVEAYGQNLAKKDFSDVFGIVVSYRF
ncbi:MAG TPA: TonB-dependent receptor [Usitatibacter sp.]|nr:TonB-dependent receptor [Usitatibacter sp.]